MQVYSKTIAAFTLKWEKEARKILRDEFKLEVRKTRFTYNRYLYPLHIAVIENNRMLGAFDPKTYQISLNQTLLYSKDSIVRDILRHELAHYLCFIKYGEDTSMHGENFKAVCRNAGFDSSIMSASMDLFQEEEKRVGELSNEKIITRIKKLLSLANSENVHEAELATLKANQLLLKFNLQNLHYTEESLYYSKSILTQKRKNALMDAIYSIIKHFMVKPIFRYAKGEVRLDVTGPKENIELAEYVCDYLVHTLEDLWKKETTLKGQRAKNSFFLGVAEGYNQKMNMVNTELKKEYGTELMVIEKALEEAFFGINRSVRGSSSSGQLDHHSYGKGTSRGRNLNIKRGIKNKSKTFLLG
jgi:hypothetical protein